MARLAAYCLLSVAAAIGVVYYAWQTRIQFYPAVIFLVTSKFSIMVSRLSPPVTFFSPIALDLFLSSFLPPTRTVGAVRCARAQRGIAFP